MSICKRTNHSSERTFTCKPQNEIKTLGLSENAHRRVSPKSDDSTAQFATQLSIVVFGGDVRRTEGGQISGLNENAPRRVSPKFDDSTVQFASQISLVVFGGDVQRTEGGLLPPPHIDRASAKEQIIQANGHSPVTPKGMKISVLSKNAHRRVSPKYDDPNNKFASLTSLVVFGGDVQRTEGVLLPPPHLDRAFAKEQIIQASGHSPVPQKGMKISGLSENAHRRVSPNGEKPKPP